MFRTLYRLNSMLILQSLIFFYSIFFRGGSIARFDLIRFGFELQSFFPVMTKIVGPKSRSEEVISSCLTAGMSGMRFLIGLV